MTLELYNSQPIKTKPNIYIYLESIRVALLYQVQKDLITFKHYEQRHSTDNTYFRPRIENIWTGHFCRSCSLTKKAAGLIFCTQDLSKGIARTEIFFAGLKKNRVRTDGGRILVAYSLYIKTHGSVSCGPRSRRVTPVSILTGRKKTQFSHLRSSVLP